MKVKLIKPCKVRGESKTVGDEVEVSETTAAWMAEQGVIAAPKGRDKKPDSTEE